MPITTELLGRLGGKTETRTVEITTSDRDVSIPAGWKKAVGVFEGRFNSFTPVLFGTSYNFSMTAGDMNGGVMLTAGQTAQVYAMAGTLTWYRLE